MYVHGTCMHVMDAVQVVASNVPAACNAHPCSCNSNCLGALLEMSRQLTPRHITEYTGNELSYSSSNMQRHSASTQQSVTYCAGSAGHGTLSSPSLGQNRWQWLPQYKLPGLGWNPQYFPFLCWNNMQWAGVAEAMPCSVSALWTCSTWAMPLGLPLTCGSAMMRTRLHAASLVHWYV